MFKIRKELCAFDSGDWNQDKDEFACPSATNVYHCIVNEKNQSGEICIQQVWVQRGYCPEYNTDANTVDTVPCDQTDGCPQNPFQSNEVYKYPVCINKTYHGQPTMGGVDASNFFWPIAIGISMMVVVAIVFVIAINRYIRRRQNSNMNRPEEEAFPLLKSESPFYKTSAFHEATSFLQNGGKFLCVRGPWGSGKTTTAKQVYLSMTGREPVIIEDIDEFDVNTFTDSVIIEEPLSKHLANVKVENIMSKIKTLCSKIGNTPGSFVICTTSDEEWKQLSDGIKKSFSLLELNIEPLYNVSLNYKNLSPGDRSQILHSIFGYYNSTAFKKVEAVTTRFNELSLGYAETCALLSRCESFQTNTGPVLFFNRPLYHLRLHLERMCTSSKEFERSKFTMLVFMSLNERKIDLNKSNPGLRELFEACDLPFEKAQLTSIIHKEFVSKRKEEEVYVLQHDVIQRMVLVVFGTHHFEKLVRFSSWNAVPGWIRETPSLLERIWNKVKEIKPVLEISREQLTELRDKCEGNPEK